MHKKTPNFNMLHRKQIKKSKKNSKAERKTLPVFQSADGFTQALSFLASGSTSAMRKSSFLYCGKCSLLLFLKVRGSEMNNYI